MPGDETLDPNSNPGEDNVPFNNKENLPLCRDDQHLVSNHKEDNASDKHDGHQQRHHNHEEVVSLCNEAGDGDNPKVADMEDVLVAIGVPSWYQLTQIICTSSCVTTFAFVILNFVFIGYEPPAFCQVKNETELLVDYRMSLSSNFTEPMIETDTCSISLHYNRSGKDYRPKVERIDCNDGYQYIGGRYVSMVSEWDLVCNQRGIAEFAQTVISLGMALSSLLITPLADRFGRKYAMLVSALVLMVSELSLGFATNIYTVIVLRFVSGLSMGTTFVIHNVINSELNINKYRQPFSAFKYILWSVDLMLLAGMAYAFNDNNWRHLQFATASIAVPVFLAQFVINETPSWYIAHGRYKDAERIVVKACKKNGKKADEALRLLRECIANIVSSKSQSEHDQKVETNAKYTVIDIVRSRRLLVIVVVLCFVWFSTISTYYGLYLTSATLAGDRFMNFFIMTALEIPSSLVMVPMLAYLGRRTVLLIFIAMATVCLLVSTSLVATQSGSAKRDADASTAFFLIGKFAIGTAYNVLVSYTPEVFPTTIRSSCTGLCSSMASIGAMLAPFLTTLFKLVNWAPGAILTGMNMMCLVLLFLIPETRGTMLPTTIEDMEALSNKTKTKGGVNSTIKC